jgi:hypothetical protein
VRAHLEAADTSGLAPAARAARAGHIEELGRYARRGRFPKNRDFSRPAPYFVDAEGTRCAMAHLIDVTGDAELVRRIAASRNNAFVRELADEPDLCAWLAREGLTVEEAALVQPSYCSTHAVECLCNWKTGTVLEIGIEGIEGSTAKGKILAVHGAAAVRVGAVVDVELSEFASTAAIADRFLVLGYGGAWSAKYRLLSDGGVDTSSCFHMSGSAPPSAPKEPVVANLLGEGECGDGLGPEWTEPVGDCGVGPGGVTTATTTSGAGGGGGADDRAEDDAEGGCGIARADARPFGGVLFVASVLLAGAIRLRTRRRRRPSRRRA